MTFEESLYGSVFLVESTWGNIQTKGGRFFLLCLDSGKIRKATYEQYGIKKIEKCHFDF